jgi:hypothetical protein
MLILKCLFSLYLDGWKTSALSRAERTSTAALSLPLSLSLCRALSLSRNALPSPLSIDGSILLGRVCSLRGMGTSLPDSQPLPSFRYLKDTPG